MKLEQKEAAQRIYIQTDIPNSEIAEILNISERTLYYWIEENGWAEIKKATQHMPIKLIDNCYRILGNLQDHLLSDERKDKPVTHLEVNSMHKLVTTITKLRTRNTLSDNIRTQHPFPRISERAKPRNGRTNKTLHRWLPRHPGKSHQTKQNSISNHAVYSLPAPKLEPLAEADSDVMSIEEIENFRKHHPETYQKAMEIARERYLSENPNAHPLEFDTLINNVIPKILPKSQNTYTTSPSPIGRAGEVSKPTQQLPPLWVRAGLGSPSTAPSAANSSVPAKPPNPKFRLSNCTIFLLLNRDRIPIPLTAKKCLKTRSLHNRIIQIAHFSTLKEAKIVKSGNESRSIP
jgi:hypothetical protein